MAYSQKNDDLGANLLEVEAGGKIRFEGTAILEVDTNVVTLVSNAGTINARAGVITTEALTTAAGAAATLTITNSQVAVGDIVRLNRVGGTSDEGTEIFHAVAGAGSFTITLENRHASAAFDGTFLFFFEVIKQAAAGVL